jgi:DNA-binding protein H-NS
MPTLNAVEKRIAALQKLAESIKQKGKAPAVKAIRRLMALHHVSLEDLRDPAKAAAPKKKAAGTRAAPAVGYLDPVSGKRWTGRGRTPTWIKTAEAGGKSRDQFRTG